MSTIAISFWGDDHHPGNLEISFWAKQSFADGFSAYDTTDTLRCHQTFAMEHPPIGSTIFFSYKWWCPKIWLPLVIILILVAFSRINHQLWATPIEKSPISPGHLLRGLVPLIVRKVGRMTLPSSWWRMPMARCFLWPRSTPPTITSRWGWCGEGPRRTWAKKTLFFSPDI